MSNGDGGGDTSGASGGDAGAGVGDSPWFGGAGGSVVLGVEGFNSLAIADMDLADSGQETSIGSDSAGLAAAESVECLEDFGGEENGDTSPTSDGEAYNGSNVDNTIDFRVNEAANSEGDYESGGDAEDKTSGEEFDNGNDTEIEGNEASDFEGDYEKSGGSNVTENDGGNTPDDNQPKEPRPGAGGDYTKLTDWRGSNYEAGGKSPEEPKDTLKYASKRLDRYQASKQEKAEDNVREQSTKSEGQEQLGRDGKSHPTKGRVYTEQTNKAIFGQHEGQQDIQDNSPVRRPDVHRGKGPFLGVNPEDMWKHKGGSAAPRGNFLPKGSGGRLSDGKQSMEPSDKVGVEMKRLKARAEAVSAWNSEAIQAYRGRLLKAPGAGGSLAREQRRWENPGAVA